VDRIDLLQLHRIDPKVPADDQLGTLRDLQTEGKVRFVGLSEVSVAQIEHAREIVPIVTVQNRYSITDQAYHDVLEYCEKARIGFIPWFPLAAGQLTASGSAIANTAARFKITTSQLALAWLLWRSPVMIPIPGTSKIKHLEENVAAASLKLDGATLEELGESLRAA
jgi:aryl-alcohol dehydrogenase-like predicted oxidoreductase